MADFNFTYHKFCPVEVNGSPRIRNLVFLPISKCKQRELLFVLYNRFWTALSSSEGQQGKLENLIEDVVFTYAANESSSTKTNPTLKSINHLRGEASQVN